MRRGAAALLPPLLALAAASAARAAGAAAGGGSAEGARARLAATREAREAALADGVCVCMYVHAALLKERGVG